ncbi:MAG TPA: tyrosine-type recombinase/integrase, partial [Kofleriaceae bacterium]|nr:tyrosine-type recombinase/integrase [Kofleriaceae bacterium]
GDVLVFPGRKGKVRTKTPVQCAFKKALVRADLDKSLSWHDLRHTCASWWVLNDGDIFRLSKLLGHKTVLVTQKTYAHLAPEAWHQDYGRLAFHVPSEPARIYEVLRDENGKMIGKRAIGAVRERDEREAGPMLASVGNQA